MSYLVTPRNSEGLSPTMVFDQGCAESRLKELTNLIIQKFVEEDLKIWAKEHRLKGETVPIYPSEQIHEKFYEKARREAERILEAERHNVVEQRSEYIKTTLRLTIKRLQFLVMTEHGKGKIYVEKKLEPDARGNYKETDVPYFESYPEGIARLEQIDGVRSRISEFRDYVPYFSDEELKQLWKEALDLASLEIVRKEENK